jgi:hypothetical protein
LSNFISTMLSSGLMVYPPGVEHKFPLPINGNRFSRVCPGVVANDDQARPAFGPLATASSACMRSRSSSRGPNHAGLEPMLFRHGERPALPQNPPATFDWVEPLARSRAQECRVADRFSATLERGGDARAPARLFMHHDPLVRDGWFSSPSPRSSDKSRPEIRPKPQRLAFFDLATRAPTVEEERQPTSRARTSGSRATKLNALRMAAGAETPIAEPGQQNARAAFPASGWSKEATPALGLEILERDGAAAHAPRQRRECAPRFARKIRASGRAIGTIRNVRVEASRRKGMSVKGRHALPPEEDESVGRMISATRANASASIAAWQPVPAAVTACRYT